MTLEYAFTFPLKYGLHARPASALQEAAARFRSQALLTNRQSGREARLNSVLSLVGSATRQGDTCVLRVEGPDEAEALDYLRAFIERDFPGCDEDLPPPDENAQTALPPRILRRTGTPFLSGARASGGVGVGGCVSARGVAMPRDLPADSGGVETEWRRFTTARAELAAELQTGAARAIGAAERGILKAHLALLDDPDFAAHVRRILEENACSIGLALAGAADAVAAAIAQSGSAYLAARSLDVEELTARLVARIYDLHELRGNVELTGPAVVVAQDLGPSQLLALDRRHLRGLVLGRSGIHSHTVILARALGVPCVTGVGAEIATLRAGQLLVVDGQHGVVVAEPGAEVEAYYRMEIARLEAERRALERQRERPGATADGHAIEIGANIATAEEAELAFAAGAEGIGVFRTEMIFLERAQAPTEAEQYGIYRRTARAAGGRPVIIRLLDIGGDKPLPYLSLPEEANPFLGWRGARIYPEFKELIVTQLRAILRAAAVECSAGILPASPAGRMPALPNVKIMIPMVAAPEEIRWVRAAAAAAAAALATEGVAHRWPLPIGIMVETPAAACALARLAPEADFFSIGTNDLAQYFYAADRGNAKVAGLLAVRAPAFLELLRRAVEQAHAAGKWIGLCGEMGGKTRNLPLLAGLGLDEISMSPLAIPAVKAALGQWPWADCVRVLEAALAARDAEEVEAILDAFPDPAGALPLIDEGVIELDADAGCKELAIKRLLDRMALAGRIEEPEMVEEAIWKREDVYATSVGFGIAIPHCKSAHVRANTIGLLRLREGIAWKDAPADADVEDARVRLVIMLVIRKGDPAETHLRLFAQLARRVMHEDFREGLLAARDAQEALKLINEVIGS